MRKWIIVAGDPREGFTFYGPWETRAEALTWIATHPQASTLHDEYWWLAPVTDPNNVMEPMG
jgi:hypothetical protein